MASKRSKVAPDAPPVPDTFTLLDMPSEAATCLGGMEVQSSSDHKVADMYTWRRKENRSPNLSMLDLLHEELSVSDDIVHPAEQVPLSPMLCFEVTFSTKAPDAWYNSRSVATQLRPFFGSGNSD